MRTICLLAVYLAAVFGGGALLAPWLYWLTQWGARHWPALAGLAANPFPRFLLRAILGLAVVLLWPLLRGCGMGSGREMGLAWSGRPVRNLAAGFAIGFGSLAGAAGLAVVCGGRTVNSSRSHAELIHVLLGAAVTAIVVALVEELIFRGALFGILRKTLVWPAALAVSSAVYAAVHFLQKPPAAPPTGWLSGLRLLPELFRLPADGSGLAPAFFTLLLAGAILALAYQRTGTLFMSIGIHAGWIFWLTAYRSLTREAAGAARWLWGGDKLIDGWLPFFILALVLAGLWRARGPAAGAISRRKT
jgi:membrane protease YdiL (CAAX protease family)